MLAVLVNCGAIIIGSVIGLLFSKKISKEVSNYIQIAAGIVTLILGFQMAFKYNNIIFLSLSMIIGGVIGTLLDIDGKILKLGAFFQKVFLRSNNSSNDENKNFAYGFLNASVLYCVGAMAIVGSFKAGVEKDYSIIFTKSILDGFMAISFASAMGIGSAFSIISVFIYQGLLTLLSVFVRPYVTDILINEITGCGGAIIVMIGINLLNIKNIKTANFLPAIIVEIIFVLVSSLKIFS